MKVTDSKVTKLEDASYQAFKQAEKANADDHAALVRAVGTQSRKAAQQRSR
ncbi:MAG: hypothetical protein ABSG86_17955 [Thermoguttaceae bacterium]